MRDETIRRATRAGSPTQQTTTEETTMKNIGLVGVGLMGHGIAKNIARKGWKLNYLRHPGNQPTADIDELGAVGWDTAAEMAGVCDTVVICVTGTPQVEDVLVGSGQILDALRSGAIVIDCSTAVPTSTRLLAEKVAAKGCHLIDAPMTRTPKEAEEGRLNLLVGGDPEIVAKVRPLLEAFSENIFVAGNIGSGHQLKLVHNMISLGAVALIAEVAAGALAAGIDKVAMIECLSKGGSGGIALDRVALYILEGSCDKLQFTIENACKDFGYYSEMAGHAGAVTTIADAAHKTLSGLVESGEGKAFLPEVVSLLQAK
ncbi:MULTISPECIES: NAD(P)-dependent oxidoreductase [Rhizobium]|uniref:NAD(P)-dependent oxidoreductase n=1 Tax=Rhizobium TaxID=379 RepID=UPI0028C4CA13|nr:MULTISPECIES: NAD(P)-dependent oxidoreductase [Rhizobium]